MRNFLWFLAGGFGMLGVLHASPLMSGQLAHGMERDVGYGVAFLVISFAAGLTARFTYGGKDE